VCAPTSSAPRGRAAYGSIGVALVLAFSPVIVDLFRHVYQYPWARTVIVFPWLVWIVVGLRRRDRHAAPSVRLAWLSLGAAVLIQFIAIEGVEIRFARLGLVGAAVVSAWATGVLRGSEAMLLVWLVPIPSTILLMGDPVLVRGVGSVGAALGGADVVADGRTTLLALGQQSLTLGPADSGLSLCAALAGIGWFRAVANPSSRFSEAITTALFWGLAGLLVQILLVAGAARSGSPVTAREILDEGGWVIVVLVGLAASLGPWRRLDRGAEVSR